MAKENLLEHALETLDSVGISGKQRVVWHGTKHDRISWYYNGQKRSFTVPISPSDHRSSLNNKAQLRRLLRQDGLLVRKKSVAEKPHPIQEKGRGVSKDIDRRLKAIEDGLVELNKRIKAAEGDTLIEMFGGLERELNGIKDFLKQKINW